MNRLFTLGCGLTVVLAFDLASSTAQLIAEPNARNVSRQSFDAVLVPIQNEPQAGNAGLFVGINAFTNDRSLQPLRFAVHDAIEQAYLFVVELKLISAKNCIIAISGRVEAESVGRHRDTLAAMGATIADADKSTILTSLKTVVDATQRAEDMLIVSISTHGFEHEREAYVLPREGLRGFLKETALKLTTIEATVEEAKAGRRLLLVDACQERIDSGARGEAPPQGPGMSADFVAALKQHTGQGKFASCSSGQYSYENGRLGGVGHGVFSFSLLEALRGGAAADQDNLVRLDAAIAFVDQRVKHWIADENTRRSPNSQLKEQSPGWYGPENVRRMPLAVRGDELETMLAKLRQRADPATKFNPELCERLVARLNSVAASAAENRGLWLHSREFIANRISAELFAPYLVEELKVRPANVLLLYTVTNSLTMKFTRIPAGAFLMGSPESELGRHEDEFPHRVKITQSFYLGVHEVTRGEFFQVMRKNPSDVAGDKASAPAAADLRMPVAGVTWHEASEFCRKLSELPAEQQHGRTYRLPTEAEWEYACRAGDRPALLRQRARFRESSATGVQAVGKLAANEFGMYDMLGNVAEWCSDWYGAEFYRQSPDADPKGPERGDPMPRKVLRGGDWLSSSQRCRPAYRGTGNPDAGENTDGFRVVLQTAAPAP